MKIGKTEGIDTRDAAVVEKAFQTVALQRIAGRNRPKEYPGTLRAAGRMFPSSDTLHPRFDAEASCTAALVFEDSGAVWTDSCVMLFITSDKRGFCHFEAIGRLPATCGRSGIESDEHAAPGIRRRPESFEKIKFAR